MPFENSISQFAQLGTKSSQSEVDAAVAEVVSALIASIGVTDDMRAARRDVAKLLDHLHSLKASRHPGRVQLATALSEQVLPLLYEPKEDEAEVKDDYRYLMEERAVVDRATEVMGDVLTFLCAEDKSHPRHGGEVRQDGIPPLFLFSPDFQEGFRRLLGVLFRSFMRNKHSETSVYKQVREILSGKVDGKVSRYDRQIGGLVRTALDRAQEHHDKAKAAEDSESEDIPTEWEAVRDAFKVAQLHARDAGYFLPYTLTFENLAQIYTLDRKLILQGVNELGNAVLQGENANYVLRQIERLNQTHDIIHFDVAVLSAFHFGTEKQRLSYKQMHDTCLGAAKTREGMIDMRPLLVAELARRPHQLARRLVALAEDPSVKPKEYEAIIDLFTRWLSSLNARRFEDEISGCAAHFRGNKMLKPLAKWIIASRCNLDLSPTAIYNISAMRAKIFD
ncbi:hypothetical protein EOI86_23965 [Hwanghaeella grinnelliae]|uniref:Uncharacterized protein n=1 Tax=Hwanghaeella grinnelliae TaxID=2500179 RepID=A0A437QIJ3_9PROT|nr:hypothetical protein [Hwanghaeella grinnelliae]RVU34170.1 hypothetical protein EOI86_23965 [Hwanghaeella grinnelliae]